MKASGNNAYKKASGGNSGDESRSGSRMISAR
jgi:hypothetical protein